MDSSRRAVESYWRSRMIDGATSDEDKVTPVYKLEEICELLRTSPVGIVKEVSEFILKRLDHKSPIVKQKALRVIKYCVGKSGAEFRREMQRHSVAVRQLLHYKGLPDALKGDALNKAVRETAQEAISAIFSEESNRPAGTVGVNKRIEGFGNTNFAMSSTEDKRSFLSEVVGLGSASIKQGLSNFTQGHLPKKNQNGNYRSPNLHRSLTMEDEYSSRYEPVRDTNGNFGALKSTGGYWGQDSRGSGSETSTNSGSGYVDSKTREEKLLDTIVTSGGVRLQPTRDALQHFLVEAAKLDAVALSLALEAKLQSPIWQVRMKAVCVLEAILRRKEDEQFSIVATFFIENKDVVVRCSESPQSSLREKATKVLNILNGENASGLMLNSEKSVKAETLSRVELPDLIDTGVADEATDDSSRKQTDPNIANFSAVATPLIDDLFGNDVTIGASSSEQKKDDDPSVVTIGASGSEQKRDDDPFAVTIGVSGSEQKKDDDPFADVSFHSGEAEERVDDLFSGMTVDKNLGLSRNHVPVSKTESEMFDMLGSNSQPQSEQENHVQVNDLMAGLSISESSSKQQQQQGTSSGSATLSENIFAIPSNNAGQQAPNNSLSGMLGSQAAGFNQNPMFSVGNIPYNFASGMMFNPAFASQPINYGAMGNIYAQQQFLAAMSNIQHFSNLNAQSSGNAQGTESSMGHSSPLPDIFQPNFPNQTPTSLMSSSIKEETKAFDFISDHLAAARGR